MKNGICTIVGVVGSFIASLFGGWDTALVTLMIFMAVDYITGLVVAGVFHKSPKTVKTPLEHSLLIFHNHAHAYGYHKFRSPFTGLISLTSQPQFIMMKSTEPYLFSQTDVVGKSIVS